MRRVDAVGRLAWVAFLYVAQGALGCSQSDTTAAHDASWPDGHDHDAEPGDVGAGDVDADIPSRDASPRDTTDVHLQDSDATGVPDAEDVDRDGGTTPELVLEVPTHVTIGEPIRLDASASTGFVEWTWDLGDGTRAELGAEGTSIVHTWEAPGRYRAVVSARAASGERRSQGFVVTALAPPVFAPRQSSTITSYGERGFVAVCPDAGTLTEVELSASGQLVRRVIHEVCETPRSVAVDGALAAVTCQTEDRVVLVDLETGDARDVEFRWGARPFGIIATEEGSFAATLQGTGEVVWIDRDSTAVLARADAGPDARGLALLPGGSVLVSRWRSPSDEAELRIVASGAAPIRVPLAFDPQLASDTEGGGVPSWLGAPAVSPDGWGAWVPATQKNIAQGEFLNGEPLTFETTLRAITAVVAFDDPRAPTFGEERFEARRQYNDRGLASAAAFSPLGDFLFITMRGARTVERLDRFTGALSGSVLDIGYAPEGLAFTPDGRFLVVDVSLDRTLLVLDVEAWGTNEVRANTIDLIDEEPLAPEVLRGKQLFNDTFDRRLARDSYIACAHCHLDGEADQRTWDFSDRGEGMRNTTSLLGRAGMGHGPLHWSGNFDEIQDFEADIRGPFGGHGLLSEADWTATGAEDPFGPPRAGRSADLDALAAYLTHLDTWPRSPYRAPDGTLTESGRRGRALFHDEALGCTGCHAGERLTDSQFLANGTPLLHDVGSLTPASGGRLGASLDGIDTPTLHELFQSAPYLHDGSAATLHDVFARLDDGRHGDVASLSEDQIDDLVVYLLSLDGRDD